MNAKKNFKVIILAAILAFLLNFLFGRYLTAKISTWPLLNRFKILSPQAPIVINTRQEVKVSEESDLVKAVSDFKPKLSAVFAVKNQQPVLLGSGVNVTNDGIVLAPSGILLGAGKTKTQPIFLKFYDGRVATVTAQTIDPLTKLVLLKSQISGLPVADFFDSRQLQQGQKLALASAKLGNQAINFFATQVNGFNGPDNSAVINTDAYFSAFYTTDLASQEAGSVLVTTGGEAAGLWDGSGIVTGYEIKNLLQQSFNNQSIARAGFGFSYKLVQDWQKDFMNVNTPGALLPLDQAILPGSPAAKAGFLPGDVITFIDASSVTGTEPLENLLLNYKPGDNIQFTVSRNKSLQKLILTAGELK